MAFKINLKRERRFVYEENGETLTAVFIWPTIEERSPSEIRRRLSVLGVNEVTEENQKDLDDDFRQRFMWSEIRTGLKKVEGLVDEETEQPIEINDPETQKLVFDFILTLGDMRKQIVTAWLGPLGKN